MIESKKVAKYLEARLPWEDDAAGPEEGLELGGDGAGVGEDGGRLGLGVGVVEGRDGDGRQEVLLCHHLHTLQQDPLLRAHPDWIELLTSSSSSRSS